MPSWPSAAKELPKGRLEGLRRSFNSPMAGGHLQIVTLKKTVDILFCDPTKFLVGASFHADSGQSRKGARGAHRGGMAGSTEVPCTQLANGIHRVGKAH